MFPYTKTRDVKEPSRSTSGSAGLDFYLPEDAGPTVVPARKDVLIDSGIKFIIPHPYALICFNKSGISTNKKLVTGASVVDEDYRGTVHIHLFNMSDEDVILKPGEKIAQFIKIHVDYEMPTYVKPEEFSRLSALIKTMRGENGFGHSG